MRVFLRDNPFRDKIRDIRFRDKNTFETLVLINSLSRIEKSVFEETGFFASDLFHFFSSAFDLIELNLYFQLIDPNRDFLT